MRLDMRRIAVYLLASAGKDCCENGRAGGSWRSWRSGLTLRSEDRQLYNRKIALSTASFLNSVVNGECQSLLHRNSVSHPHSLFPFGKSTTLPG